MDLGHVMEHQGQYFGQHREQNATAYYVRIHRSTRCKSAARLQTGRAFGPRSLTFPTNGDVDTGSSVTTSLLLPLDVASRNEESVVPAYTTTTLIFRAAPLWIHKLTNG